MKLQKKHVYWLVGAVVALSVIVEFFFAHPHYHEWYHETSGFNVAFGFLGGWLLIIVSKMLMMPLLQKKEDYYDEDDDGGDDNE